jgi:hypothetical protein
MGDTPFGSSARLSGDLERSSERERERERLEGMLSCSMFKLLTAAIVDGY